MTLGKLLKVRNFRSCFYRVSTFWEGWMILAKLGDLTHVIRGYRHDGEDPTGGTPSPLEVMKASQYERLNTTPLLLEGSRPAGHEPANDACILGFLRTGLLKPDGRAIDATFALSET